MTNNEKIRIVTYEEDGIFVAQCLEYDICAQADDAETLIDRIDCLIECELEEMRSSGQAIDPAPERFHNMWDTKGDHTIREVAA